MLVNGLLVAALGLAGSSIAAPAADTTEARPETFRLVLASGAGKYAGRALSAIDTESSPDTKALIFGTISSPYPSTPVFLSRNKGDFHTLEVALGKGKSNVYGVALPDPGEVDGYKGILYATSGEKQQAFTIGSNAGSDLYPKLTAADQQFFACETDLQGKTVLSWAFGNNYQNGSAPTGCFSVALQRQ